MKKYKKEEQYSYTLGAFPTMELIKNKPDCIRHIVVSSKFENKELQEELKKFCKKKHIIFEVNDKTIDKLSEKENCFIIGEFEKYESILENNKPHVVLVNPSNIGNIGNIIRTMLGFNIKNLAIIKPGVDVMNPKAIRASMGALFSMNIEYFDTFEEYIERYQEHIIYPFMLQANNSLETADKKQPLYSLVFGNESSGLPDEFLQYPNSVIIKHSNEIDSLNLTIAIGIALYEFNKDNFHE